MGALPPGITVERLTDSDGVTLDVDGELDLATAPTLIRIATDSIAEGPGRVMVIVLARVGFCDSAGISALVTIRKLCDQHGWRLRVSQPNVAVRRVLSSRDWSSTSTSNRSRSGLARSRTDRPRATLRAARFTLRA